MRLNVTRCVDEVSATLACPANALAPATFFRSVRLQADLGTSDPLRPRQTRYLVAFDLS